MTTDLCIIRLGKGERVNDALGKILDTPDMTTIGAFAVPKKTRLNFITTISMSIGISQKGQRQ